MQATVTEEARIAEQQAERDRLATAAAATAIEQSIRATATEQARRATATEDARRATAAALTVTAVEVSRRATATEVARQATATALAATVEAKQAAISNWRNCRWQQVGAIASHNMGPPWCANGSFITQFDLDGASEYSGHDSPIIGQMHCCAPNASWSLVWDNVLGWM